MELIASEYIAVDPLIPAATTFMPARVRFPRNVTKRAFRNFLLISSSGS